MTDITSKNQKNGKIFNQEEFDFLEKKINEYKKSLDKDAIYSYYNLSAFCVSLISKIKKLSDLKNKNFNILENTLNDLSLEEREEFFIQDNIKKYVLECEKILDKIKEEANE